MRKPLKTTPMGLGIIFLVATFVAQANAGCGDLDRTPSALLHRQSLRAVPGAGTASLLLVSGPDDPIVGFWRVTLVAQGNVELPDALVIDKMLAQWQSDGTEIIHSSRPPAVGNFCLGVWKKVGPSHCKLNHFAMGWDPNVNAFAPAHLREEVVLDPGGKSFTGTFTIDQYDQSGNKMAQVVGVMSGTRVTVSTPANILF